MFGKRFLRTVNSTVGAVGAASAEIVSNLVPGKLMCSVQVPLAGSSRVRRARSLQQRQADLRLSELEWKSIFTDRMVILLQ